MRRRRNAIKLSNDYQSLEPRKLLAADITFDAGLLTINSLTGENTVLVEEVDPAIGSCLVNLTSTVGGPQQGLFVGVTDILYSGNNLDDTFSNQTSIGCTAYGRGGNDWFEGGEADDNLVLGAGDDTAYGNGGEDRILGQNGFDKLYGGDGADRILGGLSDPVLEGQWLHGGDGDDVIFGAVNGIDEIWGNAGDDRLVVNGNPFGLSSIVLGGDGDDTLFGGDGNQSLRGGDGNDRLYGQGGDQDRLYGGDGDDVLNAGTGEENYLHGGAGNDRLVGSDEAPMTAIIFLVRTGTMLFLEEAATIQSMVDVGMIGSMAAMAKITFPVDVGSDILRGGNGPDTLFADSWAGSGDVEPDDLRDTNGNNRFYASDGFDIVIGKIGNHFNNFDDDDFIRLE